MIIPKPRSLTPAAGTHRLDATTTVDGPAELVAPLRRLLGPGTGLALERSEAATLRVVHEPALPAEHHVVEITPEQVTLTCADPAAAVWATQTLRQLLPPEALSAGATRTEWELPCLRVEDGPRFGWRGVMIDVVRHFMPLRDLYALVEQLSLHKYNVLHLHLTDDQGWRFECRSHPRLHTVGGTRPESMVGPDGPTDGTPHGGWYTQDQLRSLVAFAAERGITVVPEIEFAGHVEAALTAYPELAVPGHAVDRVRSAPGISDYVISTDDASLAFVLDVFTEVLEVFPSTFVHVGGDEAPRTQWLASPESAALAEQRGLPDAGHLQRWFTEQLRDWLAERGRRLVGWDEICDEGPLPGAVAMAWRGPEKGVAAARAGLDVVMAPVTATYFDYYPSELPEERRCIFGLTTTEQAYAFDPLADLDADSAARVLGTQCQLWTEYVPDLRRAEYLLWPRACAHAEVAWSDPAGRSFEEFGQRLAAHVARLDALGINHRPEAGPLPHQQGGTGIWQRGPSAPPAEEPLALAEPGV
ncbi:beta-N-acetylhexosaminidase [Desertihabitans aurantiacus]|uniref:beta-N-acetylhexosaminidase n=1 Tax=Desertihabitans aurantiacus TaxID=2282477 RepID=UPI0018E503FA|nr:beta-N-acetylhexosaminidase [Desertihabitans aurantiacus]